MRDIKYKFFDTHKQKMGEVMSMSLNDGGIIGAYVDFGDTTAEQVLVGTGSFLQFTGLIDKNGKELFEGDIIHYVYKPEDSPVSYDDNYVISWEEGGFNMRQAQRCGLHAWFQSVPGMYTNQNPNRFFEIVGNVYENPDMVKQ